MFCPLMSYQRYTDRMPCSQECGFYNKEKEECAILSIAKGMNILFLNDSNNSNIKNIYS